MRQNGAGSAKFPPKVHFPRGVTVREHSVGGSPARGSPFLQPDLPPGLEREQTERRGKEEGVLPRDLLQSRRTNHAEIKEKPPTGANFP